MPLLEAASHHDVLIVGSGHAGAQAAIALRQRGFSGSVGLLGVENELPYERPPLSKEYLSGRKASDRLRIRPPAFWIERDITMLPGREVVAVDAQDRRVRIADGTGMTYDDLVWATGGAPRRLVCSGHDLRGVHAIRDRADVDRLLAELPEANRIVVVGGGYIGLEGSVRPTWQAGQGAGSSHACPAVPEPSRPRRSAGTTRRPR